MTLSQRMARDAASQRRRDIEAACSLADQLDLVPELAASDLSLSDIVQQLLAHHELDQLRSAGRFVEMRN